MANDTVTLLSGIGGSQAYGLDTDQSDFDRYGVFLAPTRSILGIYPIHETLTQTAPDSTMHELGKFVRLAIKANPTILDLLYLEDYEVVHPAGQMLRNIARCSSARRSTSPVAVMPERRRSV
jgi:predicted nucleotidyltransferase